MRVDYYDFCLNAYKNEYDRRFQEMKKGYGNKRVSIATQDSFDREA